MSKSRSLAKYCSHKDCKVKLRKNSVGDTCYVHRNNKTRAEMEIDRINVVDKEKKIRFKGTKKNIENTGNYIKQLDILFLIIDPVKKCIPKFLFIDTVEVNIFRLFKALTHIKHGGPLDLGITIAGLTHVSADHPLTVSDIELAAESLIKGAKNLMPDLPPFIRMEGKVKIFTLSGEILVESNKNIKY